MLSHLKEGAVVYGKLSVHTAQETACRAYLLNHEVADVPDHLGIKGRKYILVRSIAQGDGDKIECRGDVITVVFHKFI
jgi:hypothetical protein